MNRDEDLVRGVGMTRQVELYRAQKGPEAVLRQMALRRQELLLRPHRLDLRRRQQVDGQVIE